MTTEQKTKIISLRTGGATYAYIAKELQISINTVKSFYRRCASTSEACCKYCGKPISRTPGSREKKFCSDSCRMKWWNSHNGEVNKKAIYDFKCLCCGKAFQAYGNKNRKYCSRICYIKGRFGDGCNE